MTFVVKKTVLDEIDVKILNLLQENAKLSAKELSDYLPLSQTPIYERVKKLEAKGIIKAYVALLSTEHLDKSFLVFLNVTIKDHSSIKRDEFLDAVKNLTEINEFYHTSGAYDFMLKARFSNVKEYREFLVEKVSTIPNISDIDSQIVLEEIKTTTKIYLK